MPELIRHDGIHNDEWTLVSKPEEGQDLSLPDGPALLPAAVWKENMDRFAGRNDIGIWFDSHEEPEVYADMIGDLPVIAVNFPKFTDGRGYSIARLLRERYGYEGELRAVGDVLLDQLFYMKRCGFNAYALREDKDSAHAEYCLNVFSNAYQAAVDTEQPLFRRRAS
ncbi:DUF934 domain-containing protein [Marinobacter bohaiensis]|uniref:DUF934 domain-containing protein n=1 Tax=Marinobacter bohaiensis TaxID=2201898 RepID=UPI000DAD35DD|nr:DUF934 domain-containing protein [Marinobacter bohaiensis]